MNNEKQSNWRFLDAIWENHNLVQMFTGATFWKICINFTLSKFAFACVLSGSLAKANSRERV